MSMYRNSKSPHKDVQKTLVSFNAVCLACSCLSLAFVVNNVWLVLVLLSITNGLTYTFESIGITLCFPNSAQGIVFALVELSGSLFNFVQIPITATIRNSVLPDENPYTTFNTFICCISFSLLICAPIVYSIGEMIPDLDSAYFWIFYFSLW